MLRINAFGGLSLHQGDGPLTGAPTQRRRLALLALLAVAGEKGMSRDKVLAMLWPDGETDKSRHALNQILSAQRRFFSDAQLFDGRKTLRLNPALITSDVALFEESILRGDLDGALALYEGPFLDGFFVPNSPDFEMWASDQRSRLANRLHAALDDAAHAAEISGDLQGAIKWRRNAVDLDKCDVSAATKLADLLVLNGNRAGALKVLQECQKRVRDELGIAGDPDLTKRVKTLVAELGG